MDELIKIIDYKESLAHNIVKLWMASKREALGNYIEPHDFGDFHTFLTEKLAISPQVKVAIDSKTNEVIGFTAFDKGHLDQLYIDAR